MKAKKVACPYSGATRYKWLVVESPFLTTTSSFPAFLAGQRFYDLSQQ
jgi:hypothetical protein